jgi:hypothetical protein
MKRIFHLPAHAVIEPLELRRFLSGVVGTISGATITPSPISAPVTPIDVAIHAQATDQFSGTVGILKNFVPPPLPLAGALQPAIGLQCSINWGDGKTSTGRLVYDSVHSQYLVKGTHTWSKTGAYKVTTMVAWGPLPGSGIMIPTRILATIHSTATVSPDVDGGVTLSEQVNRAFTATVGSFDFVSVDLSISATIDWGDGSHGTGKIVRDSFGEYHVVGTHAYTKTGKFTVDVKVLSHVVGAPSTIPSGTAAHWTSTINVTS